MLKEGNTSEFLKIGKGVLAAEAKALLLASERLDGALGQAIDIILKHKGKVILCGMGKSGHVAQKISSTLCSTGTPSVYLHPAEAVHGDLGIYQPGDPTILLSKSGTTAEIMRLIPTLKQFQSPIIAIVSNMDSPIAKSADIVLDATISSEADPLAIVPTASALVAMALGDALASALMAARGFKKDDFARLHPAGQLGRNLLLKVGDVMKDLKHIAALDSSSKMLAVLLAMTEYPQGGACLVDKAGNLEGIITDGDIRRILLSNPQFGEVPAGAVMTANPIVVHPETLLADAVALMEDRESQISVLPVVEFGSQKLLGLIRIHDIYQP